MAMQRFTIIFHLMCKEWNPQTLLSNQLAHFTTMDGFDVIAQNNLLMMIASDGLYQYDYSSLTNIRLLSKLPIAK